MEWIDETLGNNRRIPWMGIGNDNAWAMVEECFSFNRISIAVSIISAAWCVSRRTRNKRAHILHGNSTEVAVEGWLRIGTWNMSGWTAAKVRGVFPDIAADVLAVQETHLAAMPLQWAHRTMKEVGGHLHHGHPVKPAAGGTFGRSCGVGFVASQGTPLMTVTPVGAAWRWLKSIGRLHAVRVPPRLHLPRGLLLLSVYAPLQVRQQAAERQKFVECFLEVTHILDLQEPVLLLGDFNGSICPGRDFMGESGGKRDTCPLLSRLLGPGGAWVDVATAVLGEDLP
jgi:hypothetical protein